MAPSRVIVVGGCRLMDGDVLANEFHTLFSTGIDQSKKKLKRKKAKRKIRIAVKGKEKQRGVKADGAPADAASSAAVNTSSMPSQRPAIEIFSNPSSFAVFAVVRQSVLEKHVRDAAQIFMAANAGVCATSANADSDGNDEDDDDFVVPAGDLAVGSTATGGSSVRSGSSDVAATLPKVVGIGLCSVFELIRESRHTHPSLCSRALQALLDILQGQQPEGLKAEPADVIDALFDLLLELGSSQNNVLKKDGSSCCTNGGGAPGGVTLTSVACSCLLSLVVACGDTGKLLSASAAMLMSDKQLASEDLRMPAVLTALQRSVHAVLLGKAVIPDWVTNGISRKGLVDSFTLNLDQGMESASHYAMASDGRWLYLCSSRGWLYKVGSGYGGTVRGHVYACKENFHKGCKGWLGFAKGRLFYKESQSARVLTVVDPTSLNEVDTAVLDTLVKDSTESTAGAGAGGPSVSFSDGENVGTITSGNDDSFVVRTYSPLPSSSTTMPCVCELQLKLARKCLDLFGWATFDEEMNIHTVTTNAFDDEPTLIAAGKEFALMKTTSGKVLYNGKPQSLGIKQVGSSSASGGGGGSAGGSGPSGVCSGSNTGRWVELPITKSPKIVQVSVGHDGLHALLVAEDGSVFFVGTARRGEDGDQNKGRRQPKPVKPKKMIKVESLQVVSSSCNNGTSALVTRDGELYMFGKDTAHCHHATGLVTDLKDVALSQVALGKAHVVAVSSKGHVYTFGINNKGQCGREFVTHNKDAVMSSVAMATANEDDLELDDLEELDGGEVESSAAVAASAAGCDVVMCTPGQHKWKQDECMVCTVCSECTGFGGSCISKGQPDRNPGLPCGCGWGDSGCSECGCCKTCAGESKVLDSILAAELDIVVRRRPGNRLQDQIQKKLDERRHRYKSKFGSKSLRMKTMNRTQHAADSPTMTMTTSSTQQHQQLLHQQHHLQHQQLQSMDKSVALGVVVVDDVVSSDQEREASKVISLAPARLTVPGDATVTLVACGVHHTVLLTQHGDVLTFGSNQHGQLGLGDLQPRGAPTLVRLPAFVVHVAAGSNHTVVLTSTGRVYTFGSYQKGQLGRQPPQQQAWVQPQSAELGIKKEGRGGGTASATSASSSSSSSSSPWFSIPGAVPNVGPKHGRRPTWVGASGDQTFLKIDESLINAHNLAHSTLVANKSSICLIPTVPSTFKCLLISKADGNCRSFNDDDQVDLTNQCACLDVAFNSIWSFNPVSSLVSCYSALAADVRNATPSSNNKTPLNNEVLQPIPQILTRTLATPVQAHYSVTRSQTALHLLACLDTLTIAQEPHWKIQEDDTDRTTVSKAFNKDDFSAVNRFESHGGGWGYSGHSIEAIRFMADTDLLLGGFGLFGGRGEYTGKIKLFDIGTEGGDQEIDGELMAETDEIPYECGARQKYPMLFEEALPLQANRWYVAWARVSGPSSDCGSSGQSLILTEDQVAFYFKSSKKSNNGTDVNAGQIPQLLYRVVASEGQTTSFKNDAVEPVYVLSREFSRTVTPFCLQSLLQLLEWSWLTFKTAVSEAASSKKDDDDRTTLDDDDDDIEVLELERLVYVSCASLRLLRTYINEAYPNSVPSRRSSSESAKLVECVVDTRALLRNVLSDSLLPSIVASCNRMMAASILDECHTTFVSCFHAFYPTSHLKWTCLCDLLVTMNSTRTTTTPNSGDQLLAAILASLCCPTIKLTTIFPILGGIEDSSSRCSKSSVEAETSCSNFPCCDLRYPVLVEHMVSKAHRQQLQQDEEEAVRSLCTFRDVLDRLLAIVVRPIRRALSHSKASPSNKLISNTCSLLAAIVAELSAQTIGIDADLHTNGGRMLHSTPSRFTKTSQSRSWNTGNGSPDAICFSVDRPGIVVSGVCLYGGVGTYDYELELLDDQNGVNSDPSHAQRWNSLEVVRGSFGPDDCTGDLAEVKFERPIPVKENVKYAVRLRNHGGRTSNGDGGLNTVKGPDGTLFTFSACSLSFNGTNPTRGQIPQILYYSTPQDSDSQQSNRALMEMQARKSALSIASAIIKVVTTLLQKARDEPDDVVLGAIASSHATSQLLPMVLAHVAPIATSDPRSAVQVLEMIQEILPHVAHLNNRLMKLPPPTATASEPGISHDGHLSTTSNHYAVVESEHPYKPATVATFRVSFPESVRWMSLEFDPQCGTAQAEDALQLYVPSSKKCAYSAAVGPPTAGSSDSTQQPSSKLHGADEDDAVSQPYWPVLQKFSDCGSWPQCSVILPGNEILFSLETASDYIKDEKACFYGFKCLIVGYDWSKSPEEELRHLEEELAYLGGMCTSSLMKKDLLLPPASVDEMEEDLDVVDEIARHVHGVHDNLLSKGFALSYPPTVHQALEGIMPFCYLSNERSFLKDFVLCAAGTSGGRLARWLQPDSYVDPKHCEVLFAKDETRCGWPTVVTVVTKDQYEKVVNVPNLKLEVRAVPVDKQDRTVEDLNRKFPRISKPDMMSFGGFPLPDITVPYEVTIKDKMCYYAISMMKAYENYSFEELRYTTPVLKRPSENMMVRANNDGTYSCNWTPSSIGCYLVRVVIDGFEIEDARKVEVKDPPQGVVPPSHTLIKSRSVHQPNRVKKFVAKYSAGLRVRAHPSLQSEQIGVVNVDGVVAFVDELHNDDGVWVRLNRETLCKYCSNGGRSEAWCLQYNQHLGKSLLVPVDEPKSFSEEIARRTSRSGGGLMRRVSQESSSSSARSSARRRTEGPGIYHVVKCGASGHNVRSGASLSSPPIGMLVMGNHLNVTDCIINAEGCWVKLDKESLRRFCLNASSGSSGVISGEGWSLAYSRGDVTYLQHEDDMASGAGHEYELDLVGNRVAAPSSAVTNGASPAGISIGEEAIEINSVDESYRSFNGTPTSRTDAKPFDFSTASQNPFVSSFGKSAGSPGVFTFGPSMDELEKKAEANDSCPSSFVFGPARSSTSSPLVTQASTPPIVPPKPTLPDRRYAPNPPVRSTSVRHKSQLNHRAGDSYDQSSSGGSSFHSSSANIPPELVGVSVRELVKVLGERRTATTTNGNDSTPPQTPPDTPPRPRRSSHSSGSKQQKPQIVPRSIHDRSPIAISDSTNNSTNDVLCFSPGANCSPRSALKSTSSRRGSTQGDYAFHSTEPSTNVLPANGLRRLSESTGTSDGGESKSFAQAGTQTSPDASRGHFSIGSGGGPRKEEVGIRLSPKMPRKDRSARQQLRSKRERAQSPASTSSVVGGARADSSQLRRDSSAGQSKEPVKSAMSPLVAECLRTVFASFLWHEGVVHDAMACASFLKFHPDLPKQLSNVGGAACSKSSRTIVEKPEVLSKEQKARLRHSVEVSSSNILMSIHHSNATTESFARSLANANVNKNKIQAAKPTETITEETSDVKSGAKSSLLVDKQDNSEENLLTSLDSSSGSLIAGAASGGSSTAVQSPVIAPQAQEDHWQSVSADRIKLVVEGDLPPSLSLLLILWEGLTIELLKVITQQLTLPVSQLPARLTKIIDAKEIEWERKGGRRRRDWRISMLGRGSSLFASETPSSAADRSGQIVGNPLFGSHDRETTCELCGNVFPHPVTYHMRQAHPGCGAHAGGKGYNSGGNFCGGWAGNCGDGGVGGSSWYLICDRCRERYLRQKRQVSLKEKSRKISRKSTSSTTAASMMIMPAVGKVLSSPLPPMETHQIMKQNATFLLDLSSASGLGMSSHPMPIGGGGGGSSGKRSPYGGAASSSSTTSCMPSVSEHCSTTQSSPFPSSSTTTSSSSSNVFQCLQMLGVQQTEISSLLSEGFLLEESGHAAHRSLSGSKLVTRGSEDFGTTLALQSLSENETSGTTSGGGEGSDEAEGMPRGRLFHRSISVGTTTREWNREEGNKRIIITRKRNKSSGEGIEDGSSLLCHPSPTLIKLVSLESEKGGGGGGTCEILSRPIMAFVLQRHDLLSLKLAMKQAVRKAACRAYAMQGLNWLLRNVTQPTALHDLLWFFVAAFSPIPDPREDEEDESGVSASGASVAATLERKQRKEPDKDKDVAVCDHPLLDITIAGDSVSPMVSAFHTLLQSISDLMMMLPMGSALQQMAMRCWCLKFRPQDHLFLHRSHVFSNISKILSRSEEDLPGDGDGTSSMGDSFQQSTSTVECLRDVTSSVDVKASSRPGMICSLVDNSTETFWESGDEDRNKTKVLTVTCPANVIARMIYVHVDNGRDLGSKVSSISFKVGSHVEEVVKLRQVEVESRYAGWVSCPVTNGQRPTIVNLDLKGPDNTLRVRQVKILGEVEGENVRVVKLQSAVVLQQRNCEAETLKVFRLLTSLVFGKLILSDAATSRDEKAGQRLDDDQSKAEGSNDLKEHMVGILFSRSKLTHLQKQVCAHIVQTIRKETARVREEWEALLCSKSLSMDELPKSSDAYCFEMLSMVLALSGSSVGRAYVAQQYTLLTDLLSLLHTGSARVQRQVTSLLRRVLPDVPPLTFSQILGVKSLPPTDYSIVSEASKTPDTHDPPYDVHRMGILDVFFSCIAKALTVQMKVKGKETNKGITSVTLATSIHPRDFMGPRWWLRGCITRKLAEVIIQLLQDMAAGKLSDAWASITKGAVAENIMNLTKLDELCRGPSTCLKTPTLWLALSSLCVLDRDHVERLSSGQWAGNADGQQIPSRPTCDNHDDGETLAIILCSLCGNLCADCDRYLHLHRRTHAHQRQVFKEEEEAIRVDLHEGCGRTKLFWIMALADSKTLKAMVEFREGSRSKSTVTSAGTCKFCGAVGETGLLAIGNVCGDSECQEYARASCTKNLPCGHICGGIRNEAVCLPCLHGCSNDHSLKQDADDMCMICFTEALSCAPAIQLRCGHVFHLHCCRNVLTRRWNGPRITFGFSLCPICKSTIEHPVLRELLEPVRGLYEDVRRKAQMRLEYEGLHKAEAIATPGARFYSDPAGYAMERYAYYVCYKCTKAYFGGEVRCDVEAGGGDEYDPAELVCGACSDVSRAQMCPKHGTDFLEYKCRYCCSVAVFFCFGTTHFCNACHDDFQHVTNIPKHELPHCPTGPKGKQMEGDECPLHIQHPPTGEEFALGCGVCRNAHTF